MPERNLTRGFYQNGNQRRVEGRRIKRSGYAPPNTQSSHRICQATMNTSER